MYTLEISVCLLDVQTRVCTPVTRDNEHAAYVIQWWRKHLTPSYCDFAGVILSDITFNPESNKIVIIYELIPLIFEDWAFQNLEEKLDDVNHMLAIPDDDEEDPIYIDGKEFLNRREF
jgi:hypothetical protein